ncbi:hypothetical protein CC1G_04004 [Coprinopsis cinerea okayama7|uniref:CHAT domain-containing protein n=1 Tax=Coprinopsis cinerea (strain Okayama-7 / 130 / ATCC MYA-4618 / FGSC 9003) TaxID=240176 RepID=A8N8F7_COPC7|nr:hypothetical protein CC1G_04004 [Coprinopsis cinerea okayama7\|eukprot:XP_001831113.2 hypothetical protein CC1G_04004 [Coprinopsis cinerea okayama7\
MGSPTNSPSSDDTKTVIDEGESSSKDELEGALSRVNELLDEATKEMNDDSLANAIVALQQTILNEEDEEALAKAEVVLTKALVTRFARYGWAGDLDEGVKLLLMERLNPSLFIDQLWTLSGPPGKHCADNVSDSALETLREYRRSIDIPKLETAIVIANEALALCHGAADSRGKLLLRTGNALVLKYLASDDGEDLDLAGTVFQDARRAFRSGDPMLFITLLNLQHIACVKFVDCIGEGSMEVLDFQLQEDMDAEDGEGIDACMLGSELIESDESLLDEDISWLHHSLSFRPPQHPRRCEILEICAIVLHKRFGYNNDLSDLEECIALHREALSLRPAGHLDRPRSLNNLASALGTRFRRQTDTRDLEEWIKLDREALDLHLPRNPDRPLALNNLANALRTRFEHNGDLWDVEECIKLDREALSLQPPDDPDRPQLLNDLASALRTRFQLTGDFRDLEECIKLHRKAVDLHPPGHRSCRRSLSDLANALRTRFGYKGDFRDLEECIKMHREVLDLDPPDQLNRPASLINLANSLSTRFEHKGDFRDLEESVTLHREALDLHPPDDPDRATSLKNLANSLSVRFEHTGDLHDLEESILLDREALDSHPPGHPDRPSSLNNLANSLDTRFEHNGDFSDLEEAVGLHREALGLRPLDHPDRAISLDNLAISLCTWLRHKGDFQSLEECVTLHREALTLRPPGHADRAGSLNSLANSLSTWFDHNGNLHDLEECIKVHREALSLRPPGHPDRPHSLHNLASALATRFEHTGDFSDLEACIATLREALDVYARPDNTFGVESGSTHAFVDHPYWLRVVGNLVNALTMKYRATGDKDILDEIFQLFCSGAQSHGSSPLRRLRHARRWGSTCREFNRADGALEAYTYGVDMLPQLASLDLTLEQRQNALVHAKDLSRDAVQCAIEQGQLETAVVFLSTARSVFWSQALQFRGPLDQLDALHSDLAVELRSVTRQLEIATHETPRSRSISDKGLSRRPYLLAQKRKEVLARIRAIDGFQDFLLPPSFAMLRTAARDNPIVFLNASKYGCDILILKQDGTLHRHPLATDLEQITGFADAVQQLSRGQIVGAQLQRKIDSLCESRNTRLQLRRRSRRTAEDDFRQLLEILWDVVAEPVIRILGVQKTDNPKRIWWCPTGPFAFLPIHAAGVYSDNPEASDCLSDYVVSSYCSSPQDLIAPPPTPNLDYEMLVVVEPGDSGPRTLSLPFTMEELKKIQCRIPHERHLVTRVGSADTPSSPDAILGHINTASIVHFGCHGSQDFSNPLDSSLILSGGRLTMESLIRGCRTSNAALAYLSACETAMGDQERPDESLSLAATMQFAGFRSVVATMWSIHDEDAPIAADIFYRHLFRRGTAAPPDITDAAYGLHLAVKKLRDLGKPFHQWVPFVHHGI